MAEPIRFPVFPRVTRQLLSSLGTPAAGMSVQQLFLDVIAQNLANVETTRTPEGGPYRRQVALVNGTVGEGSTAMQSVTDSRPGRMAYDPGHQDADADGFVSYPNVDVNTEMVDLDVVVTNPTHVAVALKYDLDDAPAPVVLAMGERLLAQRIKELARKHNVPVIENPPIARALLASAKVGSPIPPALYAAIAEILAFVYRQHGRLPGGGRLTPDGGRA